MPKIRDHERIYLWNLAALERKSMAIGEAMHQEKDSVKPRN
jgi:hypothetical protein